MKKYVSLLLILCLILPGCGPETKPAVYNVTYMDVFDTVTTIMGTAESQAAFRQETQKIYEQLQKYHRLFDIYNEYEDLNNLKTVNDNAGIAPVTVDAAIIQLLMLSREYYDLTDGKVNVAMGSVLRLWHEARTVGLADPENAKLPDAAALAQAKQHISFDSILIDEGASTVFITDPDVSLDVGAVAKGWACQKAAEQAPAGLLISVGGNVCATGPKYEDGTPWVVGIQNPDGGQYLQKLQITGGAAVTSGDYQRTYAVDGKSYHHIIDPVTAMPSQYWRSVTVICADSALADCLSTALFLLPLEEGMTLAEKCDAQVLWVNGADERFTTEGIQPLLYA